MKTGRCCPAHNFLVFLIIVVSVLQWQVCFELWRARPGAQLTDKVNESRRSMYASLLLAEVIECIDLGVKPTHFSAQ